MGRGFVTAAKGVVCYANHVVSTSAASVANKILLSRRWVYPFMLAHVNVQEGGVKINGSHQGLIHRWYESVWQHSAGSTSRRYSRFFCHRRGPSSFFWRNVTQSRSLRVWSKRESVLLLAGDISAGRAGALWPTLVEITSNSFAGVLPSAIPPGDA